MASFVTTAQQLPFYIKLTKKQTHLLLNWCFWGEAIDLPLSRVWLQPHVLLLPSSLLTGERGAKWWDEPLG